MSIVTKKCYYTHTHSLQRLHYFVASLGVRDAQILPEHRTSLISFAQWIHLEAKDHDLEFVQTVLYFSTQILQRSHKIKTTTSVKLARSTSNIVRPSESTLFHVHPRRVTEVL